MLTRRHLGFWFKKIAEKVPARPWGCKKKSGPLITEALLRRALFAPPYESCRWFKAEIIGLIFITPPSLSVSLRLRRCWRSKHGGKQIDFKLKTVLNGSPHHLAVMLTPRTTMKSGDSSQGVEDYRQKFAKGKRLFLFVHGVTSTSDSNDQLFFFESLQFVASLILPPLKMRLHISAGNIFPTQKLLVKSLLIFR